MRSSGKANLLQIRNKPKCKNNTGYLHGQTSNPSEDSPLKRESNIRFQKALQFIMTQFHY